MHRSTQDRSGRKGPGQAGFTLIEIVVVVTLLLLLMSIAAPRIDFNRFRLDSALQSIGSAVMASRGEAILRQHDVMLAVDEDANRFRVISDLDNDGVFDSEERERVVDLEEGVTFGRGGADALLGYSAAVSMQYEVDGNPTIIFRRNGSASEEAVIYLTSERGAAGTSFPEDARALLIERATGRVTCYSFRLSEWIEGC